MADINHEPLGDAVVCEAVDAETLQATILLEPADVFLLDYDLPGIIIIELIEQWDSLKPPA